MAESLERSTLLVALARLTATQVRATTRLAARAGLNETQWLILVALALEGWQTNRQLADRMQMTTGGVTPVVARLAAKGYVERSANPADQRSTIIALTPAGSDVLRKAYAQARRRLEAIVDGLPEAEREVVLRFTIDLNDGLDRFVDQA